MAFTEYQPAALMVAHPLAEGQASIDRGGTARFRAEDLALVHITGAVVILTDTGTRRIAIRAARPGDKQRSMRVSPAHHGQRQERDHRRCIRLSGALRSMGLDPKAVAGRYTLMTKENLLIMNLQEAQVGDQDEDA